MILIGSPGFDRQPYGRHLGISRRAPRFAHHLIIALWMLPLSLSIALAGTTGSEAFASSCSDWEGDEARAFWVTATVETIAPCLETADFDGSGFGDASKPLMMAARYSGDSAVVEALIAAGADPNLAGGDLLLTPLQEAAAHNNNPAVARALLDAGANVDARVLSADRGDNESFPQGRYIGHSNRIVNGMTALHLATMANSIYGVVDALLSSGADVAAKDARGRSPLHLAAMATSEAAVVDALMLAGADVEAKDLWGQTPLHYALEANDNADFAAALVRGGANVNARSPDYPAATLLHKVARYGKEPTIVSMFVAGGADVNAKDDAKATPLHYAATFNDNPDMIAALIAAGADVTARMRNRYDPEKGLGMGETPLHRAVRYNSAAPVTKALLDAGANPRAVDEHGDTPLDLVRYSSREVRGVLETWEREHPLDRSGILPAGTLMYIPEWVLLEDFEQVRHNGGHALTYLMTNYSVTAPSVWDERKYTSYIPLSHRIGTHEETIMVDVMNIRSIDIGNENIFVKERETIAFEVTDSTMRHMNVNEKRE